MILIEMPLVETFLIEVLLAEVLINEILLIEVMLIEMLRKHDCLARAIGIFLPAMQVEEISKPWL